MIIRQFFIPGIAHNSYLIGGTRSCLIVDPARDCEQYLQAAREEEMKISGILQTHLHADFVSGHMDLAAMTGAPIFAPKKGTCIFPHTPVSEGSVIEIDDLRVDCIETPGHTPEHVSYILTDKSRGNRPVAVFCGDTLFVGDVGRPDLFPGRAEELSLALFSSLHEKLLSLPDYCEVFPAHGAGSLCGRSISTKRSSTIGYEREFNGPVAISDPDEFTRHLTTDMPPAPDHFSRCTEINRKGPKVMNSLPAPKALTPDQLRTVIDEQSADIVDLRRYDAFGGIHIPGSWSVNSEANFSTFAGWTLPFDRDLILVGQNTDQITSATLMLHRVGLDRITGYLSGGMQAYTFAGYPCDHIRIISVHDLAVMRKELKNLQILDVRTGAEYGRYHIPGSVNILWADLRNRSFELDPEYPIAVICGSGVRSGMACSILKRNGYHNLYNVAGGNSAWIAAGLE
ncbi:MAG TPA: MBL fold metallo-hydrolase [Methanospirillum sp.]|nr:MBL fold metallo-hydrolase [Methanospirillum sp.]